MSDTTGSASAQASLLESALELARLGYPVFPIQPNLKIPYPGSHGCKDGTTDPSVIEGWWVSQPRANIGIATAGLLVLDIDPDALPWLETPPGEIPTCPRVRTPRGGFHFYMRQPEGRAWSIGSNQIARSVDHRGHGGYVVAAPSTIGANAYQWEVPVVPALELPEVPAWLAAMLDAIHGTGLPDILAMIPEGASEEVHDAPVYADTPVSSGMLTEGQRHRALVKMAGHARHVGHTEAEIHALITRVNADRCIPPKSDYELRKLARSVCKYPPDQIATIAVECLYEEAFGHPDPFGRSLPIERRIAPPEGKPFPSHLLEVPGFIGEVMRWNLSTAPVPQPAFALAGALALQAVLAAQKVADHRGNRTNIYLVCTGNSGCGKAHSQQINERALMCAGAEKLLGSGEIASDAGLARMVQTTPGLLIQIDEFGRMLKTITDERANHLVGISTALLKLFSCAGSIWLGKVYSSAADNIRVPYPCVSMIGFSVPENLYKALTPESLSDGLIARLVTFEATEGVRAREDACLTDPPPSIVENVRWWASFSPGGNLGLSPKVVQPTEEARERVRALASLVDSLPKSEQDGGAIWARAAEKAMRLALIYACSECRENPIVTGAAMSWACDLIEHRTHRMLELAGDWLAASDFDRLQKRVLRAIKKHGGVASQTEIGRALADVSKRQRDEVLANMLDTKTIARELVTTNGATRTTYTIIA